MVLMTYQQQSPLLRLPKELRLAIYDHLFTRTKYIPIGNRDINDKNLAEWPVQPGVCRACRQLRAETLGIHYETAQFCLNIQRPAGEARVLEWIGRLEYSCPEAFSKLRTIYVVAGLGYWEPPKEYRINFTQPITISATRSCAAAYLYCRRGSNIRAWTPLISRGSKKRLKAIPGRDSHRFSMAENLREVVAVLGEHSGYGIPPRAAGEQNLNPGNIQWHQLDGNAECQFLKLPKELRLHIYELVFLDQLPIRIGSDVQGHQSQSKRLSSPSIAQTCSLLREEIMPVYFATLHFSLNIQHPASIAKIFYWMDHCSAVSTSAFNNLRHVTITAGGSFHPTTQFEFDLQRNILLSVMLMLPTEPEKRPAREWFTPPWDELKVKLQEMPRKEVQSFDVAANIRDIVTILVRNSSGTRCPMSTLY